MADEKYSIATVESGLNQLQMYLPFTMISIYDKSGRLHGTFMLLFTGVAFFMDLLESRIIFTHFEHTCIFILCFKPTLTHMILMW